MKETKRIVRMIDSSRFGTGKEEAQAGKEEVQTKENVPTEFFWLMDLEPSSVWEKRSDFSSTIFTLEVKKHLMQLQREC